MSQKFGPRSDTIPRHANAALIPIFFIRLIVSQCCNIMAYSKNDFFHWDRDIDLDLLLGEYTNSEFEIDLSDEEVVTADRNKVTTSAWNTRSCPEVVAELRL